MGSAENKKLAGLEIGVDRKDDLENMTSLSSFWNSKTEIE